MYRPGGKQAGLTLYSYNMGKPDGRRGVQQMMAASNLRISGGGYPWQTRGGAEARRRRALHLVTDHDAVRVTLPTRRMSLPKGATSLEE